MARKGFYYEKNLLGNIGKILEPVVIKNSETISKGDMVKITPANGVELSGANSRILGVVDGFQDSDARPGERSEDITYSAGVVPDTFVADADNETVDKVKARVIVTPFAIFSNEPDATIGTTTGSDKFGYNTDVVAASDQVDESDATTAAAQLFIYGTTKSDDGQTTYGLYMILRAQMGLSVA